MKAETETTEPQKTSEVLKVTLVFSRQPARVIRQQAKANYLPVTQYLKQLVLATLDQRVGSQPL
ncbi:unnamed protein product [marine sediment metagenome]|uniref:Uncharacterized protein n=1 Tax=marine sediment metagenome TaxID=412755 RepID=X1AWU0_9ZZZZ